MNKIEATKYILLQLCDWYYELNPEKKESGVNDLTILKSLKLIFLLSIIRKDQQSLNLLDHGFKFNAMPYGPVESDIYSYHKNNLLDSISNIGVEYEKLINVEYIFLTDEDKKLIDDNIDLLKIENYYLINNSASYLVDLTHLYSSWKKNFNEAKRSGSFSKEIPVEDIKNDYPYFTI